MKAHRLIATARPLLALLAFVSSVQAASTDLATAPLSGASAIQIFPNILFVLDDSGSMDWEYLPDWADPQKDINSKLAIPAVRSRNAGFNGIAYNPAVTYNPPSYFDSAGKANTIDYPSQTNRNRVLDDGYKPTGSTTDLQSAAYYYTTVAGEYCTDRTLRDCLAQDGPDVGGIRKVAAILRWCDSAKAALAAVPETGACRATQTDAKYFYPRMPEPQTSQLTITQPGSVSSIKVDGKEILSTVTLSLEPKALAIAIAGAINACSFGLPNGTRCEVVGYRAAVNDEGVTITAPRAFGTATQPELTQVGSITRNEFKRWGANQAPGDVRLTVIIGNVADDKAPTRTDCVASQCSYDEEMTNFANWWAYYRTRMLTMKTASSRSFAKIDETRRVGYMSINNNTGTDFLNVKEFAGAQKKSWYDKLFAAQPGQFTPLRAALAQAGYLYAGKYNKGQLNGVTITDPVEYYCQKNATILSTDGYWNGAEGFKLDGSAVGDQDSSAVIPTVERPQLDGSGRVIKRTVSRMLMTTTPTKKQPMQKTGQMISEIFPVEISTRIVQSILTSQSELQQDLRKATSQSVAVEQLQTTLMTKTVWQAQENVSPDGGKNWSGWQDVANGVLCTKTAGGEGVRRDCQIDKRDLGNVASCAPIDYYNGTAINNVATWKSGVTCGAPQETWGAAESSCNTQGDCRYRYDFKGSPVDYNTCTLPNQADSWGRTPPGTTTNGTTKIERICYTDWPYAWSTDETCAPSDVRQCRVVARGNSVWVPDENCVSDGKGGLVWQGQGDSRRCSLEWSAFSSKTDSYDTETDACIASDKIRCRQGNSYRKAVVGTCQPRLSVPGYGDVYCLGIQFGEAVPVGEPTVTCQASTSGPDASGVTTKIECAALVGKSEYVAECKPDLVADERNQYVITKCTTEFATEKIGDQNVEVRDLEGACVEQAPSGCPTNDPALCWQTSCPITSRTSTPNTLADVAQYYFMTDLRTPELKNCAPNGIGDAEKAGVCGPASGNDVNGQHMLTYTLGLGASGLMQYAEGYPKATQDDGSDFASIKWLTNADPEHGICSWQASGDCDWPPPASDSQTNIDDLWHAAVNGRGTYYSARDPSALAAGISSALADIGTAKGSLAAVTVTSPNLGSGENALYEVSFEVGVWAGDLAKRTINGDTGVISTTPAWSAETQLRKKAPGDRKIYTFDSEKKTLTPFLWTGGITEEQQAYLSGDHIADLSQFCKSGVTCLTDSNRAAASGENLLNFLRGDSSHEGEVDNLATFYRQRSTKGSQDHRPLGDISGSEAVYVKTPLWNYADPQYVEFKTAQKDRRAVIYVGANDGMLHAFYADADAQAQPPIAGGDEAWAYVPSLVFPTLYQLADKDYPGKHRFFVDGTPVIGDICASNCQNSSAVWKTILVGGLGRGGQGYYALDVTDPATPKALWEFGNDYLGYTYGNPVITKLKNGTWVVIITSGYNNTDGVGRLFILNASTGELLRTIATTAGDTDTPSGLAKITAWANFPDVNNTAERVYGGDVLGNLWRFDINGDIVPDGYDAHLLATLKDANGKAQAITARPELGKVKNHPVVFVGTGKLLGASDFKPISQTEPKFQRQSFYAIKDRLDATEYGNPRSAEVTKDGTAIKAFTAWTIGTGDCPQGASFCKVGQPTATEENPPRKEGETDEQYAARLAQMRQQAISNAMGPYNDGWYVDLPGDGEQSNTDPSLQRGSIVFTTNRPLEGGGCEPKASSFRYFIDYRTGSAIEGTNGIIGVKIADSLATRAAVVVLTTDKLFGLTRIDKPAIEPAEIPTPPAGEAARRVSWRELVVE